MFGAVRAMLGEMEDRRDEEVEEWGLVPHPGAVLEGREVPQVGWARAVRAPLEVSQGRFAALARVDRDDEPADAPLPMGVGEEQEEQPRQRRRLRLLSQSTVVPTANNSVGTR